MNVDAFGVRQRESGDSVTPTIVIIGAGSVEFTRELLGDVFSFPELASVRIVLHDIDTERLETAEAIAHATAAATAARPEIADAGPTSTVARTGRHSDHENHQRGSTQHGDKGRY